MTNSPVLDPRTATDLLQDLLDRLPGFTPEWAPEAGEASYAVTQIYSRYLEALAERLNRAPEKNRLAFFDQLGVSLLSTRAAQAPVVFSPILQLGHARVPARSPSSTGSGEAANSPTAAGSGSGGTISTSPSTSARRARSRR